MKSGMRGVCWNKQCNKWAVYVRGVYIGLFSDVNEAGEVAKKIREEAGVRDYGITADGAMQDRIDAVKNRKKKF